jgi:hypothetical protein
MTETPKPFDELDRAETDLWVRLAMSRLYPGKETVTSGPWQKCMDEARRLYNESLIA